MFVIKIKNYVHSKKLKEKRNVLFGVYIIYIYFLLNFIGTVKINFCWY